MEDEEVPSAADDDLTWVDASWVAVLFPDEAHTGATVSKMVDDMTVREYLAPIAKELDVPLPRDGTTRDTLTPETAAALSYMAGDARAFFSLLGHVARADDIREAVMGRAPEVPFDIHCAGKALALLDVADIKPLDMKGVPEEVGRVVFSQWLWSRGEEEIPFLRLAIPADDPAQDCIAASFVDWTQADFTSRVIAALRSGDD